MRMLKPRVTKRAKPNVQVCSKSVAVNEIQECIITFTPFATWFTVKEAKRLILEVQTHVDRIEKFRGVR